MTPFETTAEISKVGMKTIYGCSACHLKTWRTWKGANEHIIRTHDGYAVITETPYPAATEGDSHD